VDPIVGRDQELALTAELLITPVIDLGADE
jgi:hypothetical protein